MIHPATALRFIRTSIGHGVVATAFIPRGTIVWVQDELDRTFSPSQVEALPLVMHETLETYTFRNAEGNLVLCWDIARFMNHSCAPTCAGTENGFEVALRDIQEGEELTDDYGTLHLLPEEAFGCHCGLPECRKIIFSDHASLTRWGDAIRDAVALASTIPQPLEHLLREAHSDILATR